MRRIDDHVHSGADGSRAVDDLNARFYGRFPFPWECMRFDYCADQSFDTIMLNQALGDWSHARVPAGADIWVAGCGTNQAVFVALRFPHARVVGSDLSGESLAICEHAARQLGLANLHLEQESINRLSYRERFDYVVCTGVIHHNADPAAALAKLAEALKPSGVLELMVYNRYHRAATAAFQEAVRLLRPPSMPVDFDDELALARKILEMPLENGLSSRLAGLKESPAARVADALIQPVERSYTVESLEALAEACGLAILMPCTNMVDLGHGRLVWAVEFTEPDLRTRYEALSDTRRWQLCNLLRFERSPMLWFYLQRKDSPYPRKPERAIDEEFLDRRFVRAETLRKVYTRDRQGVYASARGFSFPGPPAEPWLKGLWEAADGRRAMRDAFEHQGVALDAATVNRARIQLTTPMAPYLRAATD